MNDHHASGNRIAIGVPPQDDDAAARAALDTRVRSTLDRMAVGAPASLVVAATERAEVRIDGVVAPISRRRAASVGVLVHGFGGARDPVKRTAPHVRSQRELELLIDATLWANLLRLVHGSDRLAGRYDPRSVRVLAVLARYGVAPADVEPLLEELDGYDEPDEAVIADAVLEASSDLLRPQIELNTTTGRSLADGWPPAPDPAPSGPRLIRSDLSNDLGVDLPEIRTRIVELPDDVVRIRIGSYEAEHRLIPDGMVAVDAPVTSVPGARRPLLDPLYGEPWCLVDADAVEGLAPNRRSYWKTAYFARVLHAEAVERAALFVDDSHWRGMSTFANPLHSELERLLKPVRRAVAAEAGPTSQTSAIIEGTIDALADGDRSVAGALARARRLIGTGVLGPLPMTADFDLVPVDKDVVATALAAQDPEVLGTPRAQHADSDRTVVLVARGTERVQLADLVRPLWPSVVVASDEELPSDSQHFLDDVGHISRRLTSADLP